MRKINLVILMLAGLFALSYSQDLKLKLTTIDLTVDQVPPKQLNFKIDSVLDYRTNNSDTISSINWGKKKIVFLFRSSPAWSFDNYISGTFTSSSTDSYDMAINDLIIYPKDYQKGLTFLSVSFLKRKETGGEIEHELVFSTGAWEDRSVVGKSESNRLMINSVIHKALYTFNIFLSTGMQYNEFVSDQPASIQPEKGFYLSMSDLLNNKPLFDTDVTIERVKKREKDTDLYSLRLRDDSVYDGSLGEMFWGYSDGQDIYFNTRNYQNTTAFSKISYLTDKYFLFKHEKVPASTGLVAGSMGAGVLLGLLTGFAVIPYFNSYEGYIVYDMVNNSLFPGSYENLKLKAKEFPSLKAEMKSAGRKVIIADLITWWDKYLTLKLK